MTSLVRLPDRQHLRLGAAARGFVLVALLAPVLWSRDTPALLALLTIGLVWVLATLADLREERSVVLLTVLEAGVVGAICGFALHDSMAVLGALSVPPFVAGLYRGLPGVAYALSAQLVALVLVAFLWSEGMSADQGFGVFSWCLTGLGLGLVGTFLQTALRSQADPLAPYHYAQTLIRQLIDLSGGLDSGLDPVALGGAILSAVRDDMPATALVVHVPRGDTLTPLITKSMHVGDPADLAQCEDIAVEAWAVGLPVVDDRVFAFPLSTESGIAAVVAGVLSERVDPGTLGLDDRIRKLMRRLETSAVHLDTALLFSAFRDAATAEERRRLAREMHDGVAQDIASLGYLVDALGAGTTSPEQAERLEVLRDRITAVVAEIRRSVVTLRTSVGASESLGAAIGSIARNLTEVSGVPIHVTLDERTARLRPEVEAELFRIAQEAMNNAVRHAQASAIHVHCQVHAPEALITVRDNGRGLQAARPTSHGLDIMRERALLINAQLDITETPGGGLSVSVRIPGGRPVPEEGATLTTTRDRIGA
ncbi:sensor histidine kinase [Nocardioides sp. SYSU D00038]|uniref:sensor histidine kinase n=1 Tax=Nocardioides sp. SYSU D00038 TaxID=2812554 RepID=UPI001967165E|nr:sensor histidine kinase [Nocardioides sp. SYSU D00038]